MDSIRARALLSITAAWLLAVPASAHGGAYRPAVSTAPIPASPGAPTAPTPPTPGAPSGPGPSSGNPFGAGPSSGGDPGAGLVSWRDWWHFNQDAFLDLRRSIQRAAVTTNGDGASTVLRSLLSARVGTDLVREHLAPALAKILADERSNELATAALVALARSGDPAPAEPERSLVPVLRARLSDPSQEVSEAATLALGILGDESALDLLAGLLNDEPEARAAAGAGRGVSARTRSFSAYALGLLASEARNNRTRQRAARALLGPLEAPKEAQQDLAVACVTGLSLAHLDSERAPLTSANWVSREALVHYLAGELSDPRRRALVRAHTATALARLAVDAPATLRTEVEDALLAQLHRGRQLENEVSQSCVQALGLLVDADADARDVELRAALVRQVADNDQPTRFFALIALAEAGGRPGSGERSEEGRAACRNLLLNELVRGRSRMRPWAALALGVQEFRVRAQGGEASAQVAEELRSWLRRESSPEEVGAGAIALGLARDESAIPLLREKLGSGGSVDSQGYVALALGMLGAREAIPQLRALVLASRYRPWVLEPAATALALLGDREIEGELVALLRTSQSQSTQAALARALGQISDVRAFEPLLQLVRDAGSPAGTRAFATIALGMLAERHDLPWYVPLARDRNYLAATPTLMGGDGQGVLEIF